MKTTIDLPEGLLRRAKAEAAMRGKKLRELVAEGIVRVLDHPEPAKAAQQKVQGRFMDGCGIVDSGLGDLSLNPKQVAGAAEQRIKVPSLHDRFRKYCGVVKSGVGDLSTNPKHMEGFGED
jgi:hypothetical protein